MRSERSYSYDQRQQESALIFGGLCGAQTRDRVRALRSALHNETICRVIMQGDLVLPLIFGPGWPAFCRDVSGDSNDK